MIRRFALAILVVAACTSKPTATPTVVGHAPQQAASVAGYPENALVEFAPADTPYAFASFKSIPLDALRKMMVMGGPTWRRAFKAYMEKRPDDVEAAAIAKGVLDTLDKIDVAMIEREGFSTSARFVAYGLGAYPVFRIEITDGERVFAFIQRTAEHWHATVPKPVERNGRRYWTFGSGTTSYFIAIAPTEMVVAIAPPDTIAANLANLVGEQRPARHLTTAQFKALGDRDGFTGQGLGFADLGRIGMLVAANATPDCRAEVASLTRHVPRIALGYDDFTEHHVGMGVVLELAPDLLADARALATSLPGVDRALGSRPAIALVAGMDLPHAQTVGAQAAEALHDLGARCRLPDLADAMTKLATTVGNPLPPLLAGLHGGYVVLTELEMGTSGIPTKLDGFAMVQLDDTGPLLALATAWSPNFTVRADHLPYALPPTIPFGGHVAASATAIGVAIGRDSATAAVAALGGKVTPAPLALVEIDYRRLGDVLVTKTDPEAESQREMIKAIGVVVAKLTVDRRGLVGWMSIEMR